MDLIYIISITTSIISISLAIFAMWFSLRVENRLRKNFLRLKSIMDENHLRTREVLENMDNEAESIKKSVYDSQQELKSTLDKFMQECGINKK